MINVKINNIMTVPVFFSSFNGGGDWSVVEKIIEDVLKDFQVIVYTLED